MSPRAAQVQRDTQETQIGVTLDLDGAGQSDLHTGIPFLDHMLNQVARHGLIDLKIEARGDLHIDAHHSVEDIGIAIGQALAQALGDCMEHITGLGLDRVLREVFPAKPFLGICLGLQSLMEWSEEGGGTPGLGVYPGQVVRFPRVLHAPASAPAMLSVPLCTPALL